MIPHGIASAFFCKMDQKPHSPLLALVLSGGGARGAYQAGVLAGVSEVAHQMGMSNPFDIISGVSAGAINGACVASAGAESHCAEHLKLFWQTVRTENVFRLDVCSIASIGARWAADLVLGGLIKSERAHSLLDTTPLKNFLSRLINFDQISDRIKNQDLKAFTVTATDYGTSDSVSFVWASQEFTPWRMARRYSEKSQITLKHILGSCAIPLFFPPVKIGENYFGDGCLRNSTPLSPAIHLGAEAMVVIGVKKRETSYSSPDLIKHNPTLGTVFSTLLNAVLLDGIDTDLNLLEKTNLLVDTVEETSRAQLPIRFVETLMITPSEDIGAIALEEMAALPQMLHYLLGGWGTERETAELASYLFFEPAFCIRLLQLGKKDAMARSAEIENILLLKGNKQQARRAS